MDMECTTAKGDHIRLKEMCGKRATVFITLDPDCPFSQAYATVLRDLDANYARQGVRFVGFYPTTFIDRVAVTTFADASGMTFPQVMDTDCKLAQALHARVTPETFLIDDHGAMRYHGAIDDSAVRAGRKKQEPAHNYLSDAVEALLHDGMMPPNVDAVGCIVECDTK